VISGEIESMENSTKPLRGRPEGRSPAIDDLPVLIWQLSFL
jgi:hypothetical protein